MGERRREEGGRREGVRGEEGVRRMGEGGWKGAGRGEGGDLCGVYVLGLAAGPQMWFN